MKRIIVITGVSRGLGKVLFDYLSKDSNNEVIGSSRTKNSKPNIYLLDITDQESIAEFLDKVISKYHRIDVLINNAGTNMIGSVEGMSKAEIDNQMACNFFGTIHMMKAVLQVFRQQNVGKIINISSLGANVSLPYNSIYCAGKAGLQAFCESLYYELADSPITVSMVEPIGLKLTDEVPMIAYIDNEKSFSKSSLKVRHKMMTHVRPSVSRMKVAKKVEKIIKSRSPKLRYPVGIVAWSILTLKYLLPFKLFARLIQKQFK